MYTVDIEIIFTSADGTARRSVPREYLLQPSGKIQRYGGYAGATFPTTFDITQPVSIQMGDRVEVWYNGYLTGNRVYRGYVTALAPTESHPRLLTVQAEGASFWVQKQPVNRQWAYPYGSVDVHVPFADLAQYMLTGGASGQTFLTGPQGINLIGSFQSVSLNVPFLGVLDGINTQAGDLISSLMKSAANLGTWGVDVDTQGNNRLYLRPFATEAPPTHVISIPSKGVSATKGETQSADVVNSLLVQGGPPQYPQLYHNGDFELPIPQQNGSGNILSDGDFEAGASPLAWSYTGGANTSMAYYNNSIRNVPYTGSWYLGLYAGSTATQNIPFATETITPGHNYTLVVPCLQSNNGGSAPTGTVTLTCKNAGGGTTGTFTFNIGCSGSAYVLNTFSFNMPAATTAIVFVIACTSAGAYGGLPGAMIVDNIQLFDSSIVYQDGIVTSGAPSTSINAINWVQPDAYHGAYCLYMDATLTYTDTDLQDLEILPASGPIQYTDPNRPGNRFSCTSGQVVTFSFFAKSPPFYTPNPGFPDIELRIDWYVNGTYNDSSHSTFYSTGTVANWTYYEMAAVAAPTGASQGYPRFILRSTGSLMLDCLSLRDVSAPSMKPVSLGGPGAPYQPDGNFTAIVNCNDPYLTGTYLPAQGKSSTPPYLNSQTTYGVLTGAVNESSVINEDGACAIADAVFTAQGLSVQRPVITLEVDPTDVWIPYWPADTVSLQGPAGPSYASTALPIVEMAWEYDGILRYEMQLEREAPSDDIAITKLMLNLIRTQGQNNNSSAGSGGATNLSTSGAGGSPCSGNVNVTDGTNTSAATTILQFEQGTVGNPTPGTATYTLPTATSSVLGIARPDNSSITVAAGVLSAALQPPFPTWSNSVAYAQGACVYGSDGNVYYCKTANTGNDPTADTGANWTIFLVSYVGGWSINCGVGVSGVGADTFAASSSPGGAMYPGVQTALNYLGKMVGRNPYQISLLCYNSAPTFNATANSSSTTTVKTTLNIPIGAILNCWASSGSNVSENATVTGSSYAGGVYTLTVSPGFTSNPQSGDSFQFTPYYGANSININVPNVAIVGSGASTCPVSFPVLTAGGTGGTIPAGTYWGTFTYLYYDFAGNTYETMPGPVSKVTVSTGQKITSAAGLPLNPNGASPIGANFYLTNAAGGTFYFQSALTAGGSSYNALTVSAYATTTVAPTTPLNVAGCQPVTMLFSPTTTGNPLQAAIRVNVPNVSLTSLYIGGPGSGTTTQGVQVNAGAWSTILNNVVVSGFGTGIFSNDRSETIVEGVQVDTCGTGYWAAAGSQIANQSGLGSANEFASLALGCTTGWECTGASRISMTTTDSAVTCSAYRCTTGIYANDAGSVNVSLPAADCVPIFGGTTAANPALNTAGNLNSYISQ